MTSFLIKKLVLVFDLLVARCTNTRRVELTHSCWVEPHCWHLLLWNVQFLFDWEKYLCTALCTEKSQGRALKTEVKCKVKWNEMKWKPQGFAWVILKLGMVFSCALCFWSVCQNPSAKSDLLKIVVNKEHNVLTCLLWLGVDRPHPVQQPQSDR